MGKKKLAKPGEALRRLRSEVKTPERFTPTKDLRGSGVKKSGLLRAINKQPSRCFVAARASLGVVDDEAAVKLVAETAKKLTKLEGEHVDLWEKSEMISISGDARMRGKKKKTAKKNLLPGAKEIVDKFVKTDQEGCPLVHVPTKSRKSNTFAMPVCALYADPSRLRELGLAENAQAVLELFQELEDVQQTSYDEDMFGSKGAKTSKEREKIFREELKRSVEDKSSEYQQTVGVYTSCLVDFFNDPQEWQVDKNAKLSDEDDLGSDSAEGGDGDLGGNTQLYAPPSAVESANDNSDDSDDDGAGVVAGASSSAPSGFVSWGERAPVSKFVPFGQTDDQKHTVFVPWQ